MNVVEGSAMIDDLDAFVERLGAIGEKHECAIQAFDARYVAGRKHLEVAVARAERAFERDENVARDRAIEVLLYAAGRRQIDRALEMGVGEGEQSVVIVVHGDDADVATRRVEELVAETATLGVEHADRETLMAFFEVTDAELDATAGDLADLIHERVALLDVEK